MSTVLSSGVPQFPPACQRGGHTALLGPKNAVSTRWDRYAPFSLRTFDAKEGVVLKINHKSWFHGIIWRKAALHRKSYASQHNYDINHPARPTAHHTCIQHPSSVSLPIPIKGIPLASPSSPIPRNAIHHPSLLLGSLYPCQPNSTDHQSLTQIEFVCRRHTFSNHLEYHLELSCHHFFVRMGGCSSKYALP